MFIKIIVIASLLAMIKIMDCIMENNTNETDINRDYQISLNRIERL